MTFLATLVATASFATKMEFEYAERNHDYYFKYIHSDNPERQKFEFIEGCNSFSLDANAFSLNESSEEIVLSGAFNDDRLMGFEVRFPKAHHGTIVTVPFIFNYRVEGEVTLYFDSSVRIVDDAE